jgi:hypothetical protein
MKIFKYAILSDQNIVNTQTHVRCNSENMRTTLLLGLLIFVTKVSMAQYPTYFEERFDSAYISTSLWDIGGMSNRILFEVQDTTNWNGINRIDFLSSLESRLGASAISMTVVPNDTVANKNRSEFKIFNHDPLGSEIWYGWSIKIPSNFVDDPAGGFQIMGQFHDYPDTINGETWSNYPGRSPTISFSYGTDGINTGMLFRYGCDTIQLNTSINKTTIDTAFINKGEWNDFILHIQWALDSTGYVEAWHNGSYITHYNIDSANYKFYGPNMYNTIPTYLKLGIYRDWGYMDTNSVHYDEIRIGGSMVDVALPLGMNELSNLEASWANYYPNPAKETISIQSQNRLENLTIYSLKGDLLQADDLQGKMDVEINIGRLDSGIYLFVLRDIEDNYLTRKVVVQK